MTPISAVAVTNLSARTCSEVSLLISYSNASAAVLITGSEEPDSVANRWSALLRTARSSVAVVVIISFSL
jgi:hypothetical protein